MAGAWRASLSRSLRELRLHMCQTSESSSGVRWESTTPAWVCVFFRDVVEFGCRQFVEDHYVPLKKANPTFPILVRECSGIQPRMWARYGESGNFQYIYYTLLIAMFLVCEKASRPLPVCFADHGVERWVSLTNKSSAEVEAELKKLMEGKWNSYTEHVCTFKCEKLMYIAVFYSVSWLFSLIVVVVPLQLLRTALSLKL